MSSWKSDKCGKTFTHKQFLSNRKNGKHREKRHVCSICNKSFERAFTLKRHYLTCKGEKANVKDGLTCGKCGIECSSKFSLSRHEKRQHSKEEAQFPCKFCDLKFNSNSARSSHNRDMFLSKLVQTK